jgi:hypothetical protein
MTGNLTIKDCDEILMKVGNELKTQEECGRFDNLEFWSWCGFSDGYHVYRMTPNKYIGPGGAIDINESNDVAVFRKVEDAIKCCVFHNAQIIRFFKVCIQGVATNPSMKDGA